MPIKIDTNVAFQSSLMTEKTPTSLHMLVKNDTNVAFPSSLMTSNTLTSLHMPIKIDHNAGHCKRQGPIDHTHTAKPMPVKIPYPT